MAQLLQRLQRHMQQQMSLIISGSNLSTTKGNSSPTWLLDSGVERHMTLDDSILNNCMPCHLQIYTVDGSLPVIKCGYIILTFDPPGRLTLHNVLRVPYYLII